MARKSSGLSKNIPAIFQGIPDLPVDRAEKRPGTPKPATVPEPVAVAGPVRLLVQISRTAAKMLAAEKRAGSWKFVAARSLPRNPALPAAEIERESLHAWIRETAASFGEGKRVESRLLLSGSGIYMTEVEIPEVPVEERQDAILWQIAEELPFPVEESEIRMHESSGRMQVVAIEHSLLNLALEALHEAELFPAMVTHLPAAYRELGIRSQAFPVAEHLLVHIGSTMTTAVTFHEGEVARSRDFRGGGEQITQAMMGRLVLDDHQMDIGYEEALLLKESIGMPTPQLMPDPAEPKHSQLAGRIRPIFEKLTAELRTSMGQHERDFPGQKIRAITLSGGGSRLKGIETYFSDELHLPVTALDTSGMDRHVNVSTAALSGLLEAENIPFNFAAREDLLEPAFRKWAGYLKRAAGVLGICLLVFAASFGVRLVLLHAEMGGYEQKLEKMGMDSARIQELDGYLDEIRRIRSERQGIVRQEPPLGPVLRDISRLIPQAVQLKGLKFENAIEPYSIFRGVIRPGERSPDLVISDFQKSLGRSPLFLNPRLESRLAGGDEGEGSVIFIMNTTLAGGGA